MKVGDIVWVAPSLPAAVGRGRGVITHVGPRGLLVRVRFGGYLEKYGDVACLARDCEVLAPAQDTGSAA